MGSPRFLAAGVGEKNDRGFPLDQSAGRVSAADVHDAGCRRSGGQSVERVAGVVASRMFVSLEGETVEEGYGVPAASGAASALAHRCFLHQCKWDVLLPVQCSGRL